MALFCTPGTTVRRPAIMPSTPARATSRASIVRKPGVRPWPSPAPATSANSVRVKPGDRHVTLTPEPASSACTDSENDCTNAFVAA